MNKKCQIKNYEKNQNSILMIYAATVKLIQSQSEK